MCKKRSSWSHRKKQKASSSQKSWMVMTESRKCSDWQRVNFVRKYLISQHFCTVALSCVCSCSLRCYKPQTVQVDHLHLHRAANFNTLTVILSCKPMTKNCRSLAWLRFINESRKPPRKKMKLPSTPDAKTRKKSPARGKCIWQS